MTLLATMKSSLASLLLPVFVPVLLLANKASHSVVAQAVLEPINVSIQPAVFWGVPFWIAYKEGYFEELGLDISYEVFTSGAPQVQAAVEDKSWDVGG